MGIAAPRFIGKLEIKTKEMENLMASLTDVYSSGAVEGYSDAILFLKRYHCSYTSGK